MAESTAPRPLSASILVVEDDALIGISLVGYLEELGANVTWSVTVEDALAIIGKPPLIDIAIVDLNISGVMSDPVIDLLISKDVPILLCTGYEVANIAGRFRSLPRCEKPFTRLKIRSLLKEHIRS